MRERNLARRTLRGRLRVLKRLSRHQDAAFGQGRPLTYSRRQLALQLGFTASRMEAIDLTCRLRLLQGLARRAPEVLVQVGAAARQLDFIRSARIVPGQARRLWKRWGQAGSK
jgi:hypothetical protein